MFSLPYHRWSRRSGVREETADADGDTGPAPADGLGDCDGGDDQGRGVDADADAGIEEMLMQTLVSRSTWTRGCIFGV